MMPSLTFDPFKNKRAHASMMQLKSRASYEFNEFCGNDLLLTSLGKYSYSTHGIVMAGGMFTSIFHNEIINDVDFFVLGCTEQTIRDWSVEGETGKYMNSSKVLAVQNKLQSGKAYQIIFTSYNTRQELIDDFDLCHSMISFSDGNLRLSRLALLTMATKTVIPNQKSTRKSSYRRIEKFTSRGWEVSYASAEVIVPYLEKKYLEMYERYERAA